MSGDAQILDTALRLPAWEALPDFGLYMDQVIVLMERALDGVLPKGELTKSMVNNYVKVGLIPRPVGKKYDREHLARLLMICILKQALSMEEIAALLSMFCVEDAKSGYEQFLVEVEALREAAISGRIDLWLERADKKQQALRAGVVAAICTIVARIIVFEAKQGGPFFTARPVFSVCTSHNRWFKQTCARQQSSKIKHPPAHSPGLPCTASARTMSPSWAMRIIPLC